MRPPGCLQSECQEQSTGGAAPARFPPPPIRFRARLKPIPAPSPNQECGAVRVRCASEFRRHTIAGGHTSADTPPLLIGTPAGARMPGDGLLHAAGGQAADQALLDQQEQSTTGRIATIETPNT